MKRLRVAYNNSYRTMHYAPRNVSVHPYQINHYVSAFDALFRNCLYHFLIIVVFYQFVQVIYLVVIRV